MATLHEGGLDAHGKRVAIVAGRFNDFVTNRLVDSAIDCLLRHGSESDAIDVYWVPGSFEVPQMAQKVAEQKKFHGIICIGAIIRGETNHFDVLSASVIRSIADVSSVLDSNLIRHHLGRFPQASDGSRRGEER